MRPGIELTCPKPGAQLRLSSLLGLDSQLEQLATPTPGVISAHRARLLDPETGKPLLQANVVETQSNHEGTEFRLDSLRIPGHQIRNVWQLLHDRILKQRRALERPIFVEANRATLATAEGEINLNRLQIEARRTPEQASARISFQWDRAGEEEVRISITRSLGESPSTSIRIETGDTPLPCSLFLAATEQWGNVQFQGIAWIDEVDGVYSGDVAGNLYGLELARVFQNRFHQSEPAISSMAHVQIEKAIFSSNRFDVLQARIRCGEGRMETQFLNSLSQHLGVRLATRAATNPEPTLDFSSLDVRFRIDGRGLAFVGMSQPNPAAVETKPVSGILVSRERQAVALQPAKRIQPAVNLLSALARSEDAAFPLNDPTCVQLWTWLPVESGNREQATGNQ